MSQASEDKLLDIMYFLVQENSSSGGSTPARCNSGDLPVSQDKLLDGCIGGEEGDKLSRNSLKRSIRRASSGLTAVCSCGWWSSLGTPAVEVMVSFTSSVS